MELKDIMSVSGQSGLFRYISQARNGIIVESFSDRKRIFVSAATKVSSLADVAIFADGKEVPLAEVLSNIHGQEPGFDVPDTKASPDDYKKFMEKALPDYDRNRVYVSDMKKLAGWYTLLKNDNLVDFAELVKKDENTEVKPEEKKEE